MKNHEENVSALKTEKSPEMRFQSQNGDPRRTRRPQKPPGKRPEETRTRLTCFPPLRTVRAPTHALRRISIVFQVERGA